MSIRCRVGLHRWIRVFGGWSCTRCARQPKPCTNCRGQHDPTVMTVCIVDRPATAPEPSGGAS